MADALARCAAALRAAHRRRENAALQVGWAQEEADDASVAYDAAAAAYDAAVVDAAASGAVPVTFDAAVAAYDAAVVDAEALVAAHDQAAAETK